MTSEDIETGVSRSQPSGDGERAAPASPAHSQVGPGKPSTLPPPAWRLIETAPRDTPILLWFPKAGVALGGVAHYEAQEPESQAFDVVKSAFGDIEGRPGAGQRLTISLPMNDHRGRPTHWMPLPVAPTPSEDRDKGIGGEEEGSSVAESGGTASPKSDSEGGH